MDETIFHCNFSNPPPTPSSGGQFLDNISCLVVVSGNLFCAFEDFQRQYLISIFNFCPSGWVRTQTSNEIMNILCRPFPVYFAILFKDLWSRLKFFAWLYIGGLIFGRIRSRFNGSDRKS